jgi:hypothetical protein
MHMEIKSIHPLLDERGNKLIYGLGSDNNVYRWGWKEGSWQPTWSTSVPQPAPTFTITRTHLNQYKNSAR